jgi:hypothetical protein
MSNVINFAAVVNARRAAAQIDVNEKARAVRVEQERQDIADKLGGTTGAEIIASVVMDLKERDRETKYMPAYCDPANEVRGAKYEATRDLDIKEIAKRMRDDIKALDLDPAIKVSVKIQRYSGGQSIDIRVTALPLDFPVMSEKGASWQKQFPSKEHRAPFHWADGKSDEIKELITRLSRIHGAYNRDNSDSMSDYFCVRYYGNAELDWQVRRDHEAREVAASPGTYWHESCAD